LFGFFFFLDEPDRRAATCATGKLGDSYGVKIRCTWVPVVFFEKIENHISISEKQKIFVCSQPFLPQICKKLFV
jgi:hypothetical protein